MTAFAQIHGFELNPNTNINDVNTLLAGQCEHEEKLAIITRLQETGENWAGIFEFYNTENLEDIGRIYASLIDATFNLYRKGYDPYSIANSLRTSVIQVAFNQLKRHVANAIPVNTQAPSWIRHPIGSLPLDSTPTKPIKLDTQNRVVPTQRTISFN